MEKPMNEGYVKVSWENNAKTGAVENVAIDTEASAMEEATAACLMVRHACETIIAQNCGKEKAKKMPAGRGETGTGYDG